MVDGELRQCLIGGGSEPAQARKRHRRTDPETSRWAAEAVSGCTKVQQQILGILNGSKHGLTDRQIYGMLVRVAKISESGCRSRRAELVEKGLVKHSGKHVKLETGRKARVWVRVK